MELVVAQLHHYKLKDEQTSSQPDTQAKNIDPREYFVLQDISKSNQEDNSESYPP